MKSEELMEKMYCGCISEGAMASFLGPVKPGFEVSFSSVRTGIIKELGGDARGRADTIRVW
jgi:hypothetical protein